MKITYSLNGNIVPGISPQDLKPKLPRQADCLTTRWSMLVQWAQLNEGPHLYPTVNQTSVDSSCGQTQILLFQVQKRKQKR